MLFTGSGESFNVGAAIEAVSPFAWASLGIACCVGFSVVGAAWYGTNLLRRNNPPSSSLANQHNAGVSSLPDLPSSVAVSKLLESEPRTSSRLFSAKSSPSTASSWPLSSRPRLILSEPTRPSQQTHISLALPSSGAVSLLASATWFAVSLSVSTAVVLPWRTLRTLRCKYPGGILSSR